MGMFDIIIVASEIYLPEFPIEYDRMTFQTKDLDRFLFKYIIKPDGKLYRITQCWESISKNECSYINDIQAPKGLRNHTDNIRTINAREANTDFHGRIIFYTHVNSIWYEYMATFTRGVLEEVIKIN